MRDRAVKVIVVVALATASPVGCDEGTGGRDGTVPSDRDDGGMGGKTDSPTDDGGWAGSAPGWDGHDDPGGPGYALHQIAGGWVVEADIDSVSVVVPSPLRDCGSTTSEWVEHEEQAEVGLFAAINANFFECDASGNGKFGAHGTCPVGGEAFDGPLPVSGEQYPIGVHCGRGDCFDNTTHKSAKYMSHFVVYADGTPDILVYRGSGEIAPAPFFTPVGHVPPAYVADSEIQYAASGAPTIIRDGKLNDSETAWSSLHYYPGQADRGSIPFVAVDFDRTKIFLGMSVDGARSAGEALLAEFPGEIEHAVAFDAGGSPTFWYKGYAPVAASRIIPTKIGIASPADVRTGRGRSSCP